MQRWQAQYNSHRKHRVYYGRVRALSNRVLLFCHAPMCMEWPSVFGLHAERARWRSVAMKSWK